MQFVPDCYITDTSYNFIPVERANPAFWQALGREFSNLHDFFYKIQSSVLFRKYGITEGVKLSKMKLVKKNSLDCLINVLDNYMFRNLKKYIDNDIYKWNLIDPLNGNKIHPFCIFYGGDGQSNIQKPVWTSPRYEEGKKKFIRKVTPEEKTYCIKYIERMNILLNYVENNIADIITDDVQGPNYMRGSTAKENQKKILKCIQNLKKQLNKQQLIINQLIVL